MAALTEAGSLDDVIITKTEVLAHLADVLRHGENKDRVAAAKVISHVRGFGVKRVEQTTTATIKNEGLTEEQILAVRAKFLGVDPAELAKVQSKSSLLPPPRTADDDG
jgi:hypothetical protein